MPPPPRVVELSDLLAHSLRNPASRGEPGVCRVCSTFCPGYETCYACGSQPEWLDAVEPISLSVNLGQLHTDLRGYKDNPSAGGRRNFQVRLTSVLWRFLEEHERCLARATGVDAFDRVTTVPSRDPVRDESHPLRMMVGEWCAPIAPRFERLLRRTDVFVAEHEFHSDRYVATRPLAGDAILLVEDTWTTGANAQSAACALKTAGARAVGLVVIGRHIRREYEKNAALLDALPRVFSWETCWRHDG